MFISVLHHSFNRPLDLIEFVEYYLLLGASHFTFYNSSVSAEVDSVLQYYVNRDLATVLTWKLPQHYVFERTLRADGLFAGLNDCLYRNSFYESYDYVANFGTDEFLVPRIHENLPQLMEYLDPTVENNEIKHITQNVLFLFRNAFFYTMYDDSTDKQASESVVRKVSILNFTLHQICNDTLYDVEYFRCSLPVHRGENLEGGRDSKNWRSEQIHCSRA